MQFQNPEILYFLALLIIPILIHLFQLQKFVKVPFTNVAFLEKIEQETRKSSNIKKWLILATRLLIFLAILFAFSQPYFSNKNSTIKQHTFIYLDNSLSTNTKGEKGNLLKISAQEIIDNASQKDTYTLQTNDDIYKEITYSELKNKLINLKNSTKNLNLSSILLRIKNENKSKTKTLNKNILISDFQYNYIKEFTNVTPSFSTFKLTPSTKTNLSIDSVFINYTTTTNSKLNIIVKNQGEAKSNIPIAIFNKDKLMSKQSFSIEKDVKKTITFSIDKSQTFLGKIEITFSDTFNFDNTFYFNLNNNKKIDILSIGESEKYLSKIYTKDEFNFTQTSIKNINYSSLLKQQIIILNELKNIPEILNNSLFEFSKNGGTIAIIPNEKIDLNSYNRFLRKFANFNLKLKVNDSLKITDINFNHPLFKNVFSKKVNNFQYPTTKSYYPISSSSNSKIISFQNNAPFLSQIKSANSSLYIFSSALSKNNSNFLNSPLIVPVFYNIGKLSFQNSKMYYHINEVNEIDIDVALSKDEILNIKNSTISFIPPQQTFQNKVTLKPAINPSENGFYYVMNKKDTLKIIAFNNPKNESILNYLDIDTIKKENNNITIATSIADEFNSLNKKNEVHWLWKWFLALAIVSLFLEILILKFYKS